MDVENEISDRLNRIEERLEQLENQYAWIPVLDNSGEITTSENYHENLKRYADDTYFQFNH